MSPRHTFVTSLCLQSSHPLDCSLAQENAEQRFTCYKFMPNENETCMMNSFRCSWGASCRLVPRKITETLEG